MNLLYLDDNIDILLEKYLVNFCIDNKLNYAHYLFEGDNVSFIELITSEELKQSNILILDSFLFEANHGNDKRFTGEDLYLILKKIYPYIEVIVVSNKPIDQEIGDIIKRKYSRGRNHTDKSTAEHYDKHLKPHLKNAVDSLITLSYIKEKISKSSTFDSVLIDKINNSFQGVDDYDELQKKDIDDLIKVLKEVL